MELLYLLEKIRLPGLNEFMLAITYLGDEIAFLVVALILFWCVDKRRGYYVLAVGFFGTLANQFLKLACRVPRPWKLDENFTILEQAREGASGYSFPSGHTQSSVGTFGAIACTTKNRWVRRICITVAVLVPFSRMYVGVHTPWDVLAAALMAIALIFLMKPIVYKDDGKWIPVMLTVGALLSLAFLCYVELWPFPADIDHHNLESGVKNAYTLLGALLGMMCVCFVDEKWLHFQEKAPLPGQILKVILGLLTVLAVKEGLRAPLEALFGGHMIARGLRYFLLVLVAGIVWPLTFRWFARVGKKESRT